MGKGIALTIKKQWPEAYLADLATTKGDPNKLGGISTATVLVQDKPLVIVNAYTQYLYNNGGAEDVLANYEAIEAALLKVKQLYSGKRIALPLIGAGLAKGDWNLIYQIITKVLDNENVTVVKLPT